MAYMLEAALLLFVILVFSHGVVRMNRTTQEGDFPAVLVLARVLRRAWRA